MVNRSRMMSLAALGLVLTPLPAYASGGWEGFFTVIMSLVLAGVALAVVVTQAIVLAAARSPRARSIFGTVTLILDVLLALLGALVIAAEFRYTMRNPAILWAPLLLIALVALSLFLALRLRRSPAVPRV